MRIPRGDPAAISSGGAPGYCNHDLVIDDVSRNYILVFSSIK